MMWCDTIIATPECVEVYENSVMVVEGHCSSEQWRTLSDGGRVACDWEDDKPVAWYQRHRGYC